MVPIFEELEIAFHLLCILSTNWLKHLFNFVIRVNENYDAKEMEGIE